MSNTQARKLTIFRNPSEPIRLEVGEAAHLGVEVHEASDSVSQYRDRLDSRRLAQHSAKGLPHPVRVPTEQEEADRQMLRLRELLVRKIHAVPSQIKSFLLQIAAGFDWSRSMAAPQRDRIPLSGAPSTESRLVLN